MTDHLRERLTNAYRSRRGGDSDIAYAEFKKIALLCRKQNDTSNLITALKGLAQIERDRNQPSAALPFYLEAEGLARAQGDGLVLAHTIRHLADLHQELGELETAEQLYVEALVIYRREPSTDDVALANTLRPLALVFEMTAKIDDAKRHWEDAKILYTSAGIDDGIEECNLGISRCS